MEEKKILIVEDHADIVEILRYAVTANGYQCHVCSDGEAAIAHLKAHFQTIDMVLLDLMLPNINGLEICERLRAFPPTAKLPIIMITAKGEESDVVRGLHLGADDYVIKPFKVNELMARIQAVFRRLQVSPSGAPAKPEKLQFGKLLIDPNAHQVSLGTKTLHFTLTEFQLIYGMAKDEGQIFTRDQLIDLVKGENVVIVDRNIDVHISSIRKKIGRYGEWIKTIRGVGYRFVPHG